MEEDFDVVHNMLYYIYTNSITFSTVSTQDPWRDPKVPRVCDAEDIYALAHRLELETLRLKALHFLRCSCNVGNITARVFRSFASFYEEVGMVYDEYIKDHWQEVALTSEFEEYFWLMDKETDNMEIRRVFGKYREITKELISVKN